MDKQKLKKIGNIALNVLLYLFLAICIFSVIVTVFSKKDYDGAAEIFGYQMRVVTSNSMAASPNTDVSGFEIGSIPIRSMVFVKTMPDDPAEADAWYRTLKVGDVLTFRYVYDATQVTITHRIVSITEKEEGGFVIDLAGDNKASDNSVLYQTIDTSVPYNTDYVIGKVTGQSHLLGLFVNVLMTPAGLILIVILPCVIIIGLEVMKIIKALNSEKRKREREEQKQKEDELEELRRRLAALETASGDQPAPNPEQAPANDAETEN